jgi:hypothetical protein
MLAMLCKASVARKVLLLNYQQGQTEVGYRFYRIDAAKEFKAAVDAGLFICDYTHPGDAKVCEVYSSLESKSFAKRIGIVNDLVIADIDLHHATHDLVAGTPPITWRSGVKHDAAKVMELTLINHKLYNGFKEEVEVEDECIFPLLKSSDLANQRLIPKKFVIITQHKVGEDTAKLKTSCPKLWRYLTKHADVLDQRKSSIYRNQPRFAIFGVGDYTFMPYKIAISGLYKKVNFCLLKPYQGKPIVLDDTCYLLGFKTKKGSEEYLKILASPLVQDYITSLIFNDAKRPITSDLLKTIDVPKAKLMMNSYHRALIEESSSLSD